MRRKIKTERIALRISPEIRGKMNKVALMLNVSRSHVAHMAIESFVSNWDLQPKPATPVQP